MLDVLGWLIFLAALMISVMLHETGHFVAAKRFGMKCTQYFIGFGPTIWSTQRGETEYGVKALPLGGFVKITGMTSIDEVDQEDEPRSFRRAPGWQRLIVLGALVHALRAGGRDHLRARARHRDREPAHHEPGGLGDALRAALEGGPAERGRVRRMPRSRPRCWPG